MFKQKKQHKKAGKNINGSLSVKGSRRFSGSVFSDLELNQ
jgi:hypothetical protein